MYTVTKEDFDTLSSDNQKIALILLEILRELKGINQSVAAELNPTQ